jgi:hypothetical protein
MEKQKITKFSADASKDLMEATLESGEVVSGWEAIRDIRCTTKSVFDPRLCWVKVEDEIWYEENFSENNRKRKMMEKGLIDF